MRARTTAMTTAAFVAALVLCTFIAGGSATIIEQRSRKAVRLALETASHSWVQVETDGLQVILLGTAPTEAARFRAVTLVSTIVDSSRIIDNTDAEVEKAIAPPAFSLQLLRNDEGTSLIGLVPRSTDRKLLLKTLTALSGEGSVTDMLESADYPVPPGWNAAFQFGIKTLESLPRSKVSINAGRVAVEAIADSPEEKAQIETTLSRRRPTEVKLDAQISAPRPVITPFTLRFLIDEAGPRFDACAADTDRARTRILSAARKAGAQGDLECTVGMGTPSPQWADAVVMGLDALRQLGAGTLTFSDADIALVAADSVNPATYDKVIGELESNLPEVFSLTAELTKKAEAKGSKPEFSALLREDGQVELRGRINSDRSREALESFARAQFGAGAVYGATRVDTELPQGWPVRTLTALEALRLMHDGSVSVTADLMRLSGVTGDRQASDKVARLFAQRLGEEARIELAVKYDRRLDPTLALPDGPECVTRLNTVLAQGKLSFEPSSATISAEDGPQLDALAKAMAQCQDFRMEVAGHTDSQGSEDGNLRLSQNRAEAVIEALRGRAVLTANLAAKGYGEARPIADNDSDDGREANRRIEFVLLDAAPVSGGSTEDLPAPVMAPEAAPVPVPPVAEETEVLSVPDLVLEEGAVDGAPMEEAPMEDGAPMEGAPMEGAPMEEPPAQAAPAETAAPGDVPPATPVAPAPAEHAPVTAAPTEPAPSAAVEAPVPAPVPAAPAAPAPPAPAQPAEAPASPAAAPPAAAPVAAPVAPPEPIIEIPVSPAAQSPGHPKPRPQGLGKTGN